MSTPHPSPTLTHAAPKADWLDHVGPAECRNCGEPICSNFEGRRGAWGHSLTDDPTCDPSGLYTLPTGEVAEVSFNAHNQDTGWVIVWWGSRADYDADVAATGATEWYDRATVSMGGLDREDVPAELGAGVQRVDVRDLTAFELARIALALDAADNMHGPLAAEVRRRVFAAIEHPGRDTWLAARSCVVGRRGFRTMWKLLSEHVGPDADDGAFIPSRRQIIDALTGN